MRAAAQAAPAAPQSAHAPVGLVASAHVSAAHAPAAHAPVGLASLRAQVADVVATSRPAGPAWPTGLPSLDSALGGGIPRGRITEVVGMMGAGRATLLREVVTRVLQGGAWVAWIDARRTAAPQSWVGLGQRLVMVRPLDARRGAWCADQLLRSGVFALVVLDGAPMLPRVQGVRLSGLARERDAALVIVADGASTSRIGGTVRLRVQRAHHPAPSRDDVSDNDVSVNDVSHDIVSDNDVSDNDVSDNDVSDNDVRDGERERGFSVIVEKGAALRTVEVNSAVVLARRVCTDSEIPDRRGVARGARRPWTARGGSTDERASSITWGGLGASVGDAGERSAAGTAGGVGAPGDTARPALSGRALERVERDHDRRTREWATYRGRRRAAETSYGRHTRRDGAQGPHIRTRGALGSATAGVG